MDEMSEEDKAAYEERLQRRLQILRKTFEDGNIRIPKDDFIRDSLLAVRCGPDGMVDLNTVNGVVRSMALAVQVMNDREELKSAISLQDIQETYFKFIENNFGEYYKIMVEKNLTPHDVGIVASRDPSRIDSMTKHIPKLLESLQEFWNSCADAAFAHVEDMRGALKGVFGGDLFPAYDENIASKCGIYTDTIILPDPFMRSKDLFSCWSPDEATYYLFKHGMSLLQYKDLACAKLEKPIVVVLPDRLALEENERNFVSELGQKDSLLHAGRIFGRKFESFDDLMEFASSLDSIEKVMREIKDNKRVLFNAESKLTLKEQLAEEMNGQSSQLLRTRNPGVIVALQSLGRMSVSNEILLKSRRLLATPIIDAPTSWQYFNWKLEYDAERAEIKNHLKDLHILRGLQNLAGNEMIWLGRVPNDALIEIRQTGALEEIRSILGKGIEEIATAKPNNFHRTTDQIFDNINAAFDRHQTQLKELRSKKWKFAGKDIGSWLVVGSIEVAAAATGLPVWGLATIAAHQLMDAPKLKAIPKSIKELASETEKLHRSPVGMLFNYSGKKK